MEDNVTLCTNCQRQIAASNFVTHSVHCQRNLVKCEDCGEAVPRAAFEEHHAEFHALVSCPNCNLKTERNQLEKHQKFSCKYRQQNCQYCELEFTVSDLYEHENYCGSRTKLCDGCGEYVMLKHEQLHLNSDHEFVKNGEEEPGRSSKIIKNNLESIGSKKSSSNNNLKKPQLSNKKSSNAQDEDLSVLIARLNKDKVWAPPRFGGVAYPLSGFSQRTISPPPPRQNSYSDDDNEGDLVALPCEFCGAMIPSNQLLLHQTGCQPEIASFGFQSKPSNFQFNPQISNFGIHSKPTNFQFNPTIPVETQVSLSDSNSFVDVVDSDDSDIDVLSTLAPVKKPSNDEKKKTEYDETELPCEFCGEGYPPGLLLEHQDVCDFHPKNWRATSPVNEEPVHQLSSSNLLKQQKLNKDFNLFDARDVESQDYGCNPASKRINVVSFHCTPHTSEGRIPSHIPTPESDHEHLCNSEKPVTASWCPASEKVIHCPSTPVSLLHNPKCHPSPQIKDKSCSTMDHHFDLKSLHPRFSRAGNHADISHSLKKESLKKSVETNPVSSCNHGLHKVDFVNKPSGSLSRKREASCSSSLFIRQDSSRVPVHDHKDIPTALRTLPPNLSCPFRQSHSSGVTAESVPNPLSDSVHKNRAAVATEWNDLNLARPTSATGAIPKAKAGKLNIARQVIQEIPGSRCSNNQVTAASRADGLGAGCSHNHPLRRKASDKSPVRNKFNEYDD